MPITMSMSLLTIAFIYTIIFYKKKERKKPIKTVRILYELFDE